MDIKVFTIKEYLKARRLCPNIFPKLCLAEEKTKYNGVRIDIWTHLTRECIINYVH